MRMILLYREFYDDTYILKCEFGVGVYGVMQVFRDDRKHARLFADWVDCTIFNTHRMKI